MQQLPIKLSKKLDSRRENNSFRYLKISENLIDFSSNDYLGFSGLEGIYKTAGKILQKDFLINGSRGSRLLTGNLPIFQETEAFLANFHKAEAVLIFNSGYDANLGFFSAVPQKDDLVFYDEFIHASIRDGIKLGLAKAFKFTHNNLKDLFEKVNRQKKQNPAADIYIVTESVFSMDGDSPDLKSLAKFSSENGCFFIVDEAHATGIFGKRGKGLVEEYGIEKQVFARIITFGKALGSHGAAILGCDALKDYLVNFTRSFIYTTALPPHSVATILATYLYLQENRENQVPEIQKLKYNITFFESEIRKKGLRSNFIKSNSAIHSCIFPGNDNVKDISQKLKLEGFDVRPILSPSVPKGKERLRFCIHSFNSEEEISGVLRELKSLL